MVKRRLLGISLPRDLQFAIALARIRKLAAVTRSAEYRRALRRGVAAGIEHEHVPFVNAATVIDVGANRGQFSLVARMRFPRATLHAFEPQPAAARILAGLFDDDAAIHVHTIALGASSGERELHVARADDSSSLLAPTAMQERIFRGTDEIGRIRVPSERLDTVLPPAGITQPCLLKIDVQGSELDVLRGAEGTLAAVDQIYVECSFTELYAGQALADEIIAHLRARGFRLAGIFHPTYDGDGACVQADFLFDSSS